MKRKLLSLLLSAVMLFTLVTPAFADEEQLPDEAIVEEETVGEEVGEETVTEDEGGEVTLFGDPVPVGGGAVVGGGGGGGSDYVGDYCYDEDGVATFTLYGGFRAAMNDERVTAVRIEENHNVTFSSFDEMIYITKPLIIDGTLRIENTYVTAVANVTVNGRLEIYGDFDGHYTEWHMDAPEEYWDTYDNNRPDTLDGPKLINNGEIRMDGLSGIMLAWPCDYAEGEDAELSGGEFKYADYLDYKGNPDDPGLTACYTADQTKIETVFYDDNGREYSRTVLRTAYVNTEMGLKTALKSDVYNSSIQVFGDEPVTLSAETLEGDEYTAPCTLMTNVAFTVGEGVTLNLAEGTFNQFNNGLTVAGTLNVNTNGNMCFVNGGLTVAAGGTLNNAPGSNLNINGGYTNIAGTLTNNGNLGFYGEEGEGCVDINGELINNGRMENCNALIIKQGGQLTVNDSDKPITYDPNARNEWGDELGWETAQDHVLFNRAYLKVEEDGTLTVGGALQNDGGVEVCGGTMNILASAAGDNMKTGVINGSVRSFGSIQVKGGTLEIKGAEAVGEYAAVLVNASDFSIWEGANVYLNGALYQYGYLSIDGNFYTDDGSEFYNYDYVDVRENGAIMQSGYVQNDNRITVDGAYNITPAKADNTNNGNCVGQDSVLCNNGELLIFGSGKLDVRGGSDDGSSYSAIVHNNNRIKNEGGTLTLGGLLRNFAFVENRGSFTVAKDARIENHNQLRVEDSASYHDWGYEPITWEAEGGKPTEANLSDDFQLRLAQVREEGENTWFEQRPDVYSIKGDEWHDMVIVDGQDYFGGWEEVEGVTVEMKNLRYNRNGDRDEQGELDETVHICVWQEDNGRFALRFEEWGETRVVLRQTVTPEVGDPINREYRYDGGVCLNNDGGFYTDRDVLRFEDDEIRLDIDKAQKVSVLGNTVNNLGADTVLWFIKENGFNWGEINNDTWVKINGQDAEIDEPDENGWYHARVEGREYLMLRAVPRDRDYDESRFDILCLLNDDILESFDFELHVGGSNGYLRCEYDENRPEVYIENTAVQTAEGSTVTVAVKAKNVGVLGGFDLTVGYDADAFTFTGAELNSEFMLLEDYTAENGSVRIPSAACNANSGVDCNEDTLLFTLTFKTTRELGAEDDLHLWFDGGENMLTTLDNEPQIIPAARRSGTVEAFIPGDVLRDGKVDIRDAVRLLRASAKLVDDLSAAEREAALLVENETEPSVNGVLAILNYLANGAALAYKGVQ